MVGSHPCSTCRVPHLTKHTGNPGSGKTILASSVVEEIAESGDQQPCYFFFKYDDPQSWRFESALRSALAQILHRSRYDPHILSKFSFARSDISASSGQEIATPKELLALFRLCAAELGQITLILDGIDECEAPVQVARQLKELVTTAPVKLICFSRTSVDTLQRQVKQQQQIRMGNNTSSSDIRLFLVHQLQDLQEDGKLPPDTPIEQLADTLVRGADGMFLWGKLMIGHLSSLAFSPNQRLVIINSVQFPEGLDAMYDRIVQLIVGSDAPSIEFARRILLWVCYAVYGTALSQELLHSALKYDQCSFEVVDLEEFGTAAVSVCGGLVECSISDCAFFTIRFTHLTVKKYLTQRRWIRFNPSVSLVPDAESAAIKMSSLCLRYLITQAQLLPPKSNFDIPESFSYKISFEHYSSRCWVEHLRGVFRPTLDLIDVMAQFFDQPLAIAFWLQCLYKGSTALFHNMDVIQEWAQKHLLSHVLKDRTLAKEISELYEDIQTIDLEWGGKLHMAPALLLTDVLVFPKTRLQSKIADALGNSIATHMVPMASSSHLKEKRRCLASISSTSSDGDLLGSLSIYTSPAYERFWKSIDAVTAFYQAEEFCEGWTARYEVWSVESRVRKASMDISIACSEIRILIRQSFRQDPFKAREGDRVRSIDESFETSFPMAIGPDCLAFVILRTVHSMRPTNSPSSYTCTSDLLPLNFLEHFASTWGPSRAVFEPDNPPNLLPKQFHVAWYDWYTYAVSFSASGRYIAFTDYQAPCKTQVAVFEIDRDPHVNFRLVNWTTARIGPPRVKEMVFHSKAPILAFLGEGKAWVWRYQEG
jgi:hypothetical protein